MQIRKPLLKSSLLDQNLTEEEVNMKFVQDLLNWVDEMQVVFTSVSQTYSRDNFFFFFF